MCGNGWDILVLINVKYFVNNLIRCFKENIDYKIENFAPRDLWSKKRPTKHAVDIIAKKSP
jgi:hypothetical protein